MTRTQSSKTEPVALLLKERLITSNGFGGECRRKVAKD